MSPLFGGLSVHATLPPPATAGAPPEELALPPLLEPELELELALEPELPSELAPAVPAAPTLLGPPETAIPLMPALNDALPATTAAPPEPNPASPEPLRQEGKINEPIAKGKPSTATRIN